MVISQLKKSSFVFFIVALFLTFGCNEARRPTPPGISQADTLSTNLTGPAMQILSQKNLSIGDIEYLSSVLRTADNGYVLMGTTFQHERMPSQEQDLTFIKARAIKLNATTDTMWSFLLGGPEICHVEAAANSPDGGYILAGNILIDRLQTLPWVARLNADGKLLWKQVLDSTGNIRAHGVTVDVNGNILAVGMSSISTAPGSFSDDGWVTKLTMDGTVTWTHTLGIANENEGFQSVFSVNGDFILLGNSIYAQKSNWRDLLAMRIGPDGDIIWRRQFGKEGEDHFRAFAPSWQDSAFVLVATTHGTAKPPGVEGYTEDDVWVLKMKMNGELLWNRTYGGPDHDDPGAVTLNAQNEVVIGGVTTKLVDYPGKKGVSQDNCWLITLDNNGQKIRSRLLMYGHYSDQVVGIAELPDGRYVVAGSGDSSGIKLTGKPGTWVITMK